MSYHAILEYLAKVSQIYFQSDKKQKSRLLNHACEITGFHRKALIRRIALHRPPPTPPKKKPGAKAHYPEQLLLPHIEALWNSMERISARRMKAAFKDWLPYYHDNGVNRRVKLLLEKMSVSTLDRFLSKLRKRYKAQPKRLSSTSPASYMKNKVPINTLDSNIIRPGYAQADTVAHCGDKLIGEFMNTVTVTDIFSTWTENRALFTKRGPEVKHYLGDIEKALPFDLIAINTDSGSEFLNAPVFNQFRERKIIFTRSRPYKKNDNCYVEQKNYTHVRELFGYQRFEEKDLRLLMNDIYVNYWNPLQNYFLPSFKLKDKIRLGGRIKKVYGMPMTPYQRLMESSHLTEEEKEGLAQRRKGLNPFELKAGLEQKLSDFFKLADVYNRRKGNYGVPKHTYSNA